MSAVDRYLESENLRYGAFLRQIPKDQWPAAFDRARNPPKEVWRSRDFLVQVFQEGDYERLTVSRTAMNPDGRWKDRILWDDLQRLKRECGRGDLWCVECYPPDCFIVDDANMRHLWVLEGTPPYGWKWLGA